MQLPVGKLAAASVAWLALALGLSAPAGAQIAYGPCGDSNDFACGHIVVPLDPGGVTPGTLTLALRRHRAPVEGATSAVVALAGGPGQSAIPFSEAFTELLGPILSTRDLIVLDQRGTGLSHPLSCHAFEGFSRTHSPGELIARCASQIGPTRAFFTTADSVADIEALREAGGYEKLVLYGTSYGTKVAEEYAQDYPSHVEALILDSVVTPNGPDPLNRATFAAIPRVLRQVCAYDACAHITANPAADLARLVKRMHAERLRGRYIDAHGHAHPVRIATEYLLGLLLAGDFSPLLRAEFVPAVRSAAAGDSAALTRLFVRTYSGEEEEGEEFDNPLYFATSCEEEQFPFSRAASPQQRIAQARTELRSLPAGTFAPFSPTTVLGFSDIPECAFWPFPASIPAPPLNNAPLPNVPTLILSGQNDLRTPTANAQSVAKQIPDAHLLVVPYAGHSVLTDEPTPCAREALHAMFAGKPIAACKPTPPPPILLPPPLAPTRLAAVAPARGSAGTPGRTLQAVKLTFTDFARQLTLEILQALGSEGAAAPSSLDSGGLRAGWAQFTRTTLSFHGYSYVPGVTISGTVTAERIDLHVGGSSAARGTLLNGPHHTLVGVLGGRHVHLSENLSAASARSAPLPDSLGNLHYRRTAALMAPVCRALGAIVGSRCAGGL